MSQIPVPQGRYQPAVRWGNIVCTAGMTSRKNGKLLFSGKVTAEKPAEEYRQAVEQAAANALTAARSVLTGAEEIGQILSLTVYINAEQDFTTHAKIGDLASDYLVRELGAAGIGARAALGVATLPGNAPVEIQLVAGIREAPQN